MKEKIFIITIIMNFLRNGLFLLSALLTLASCSEDNPWSGSGDEGAIRLDLHADGRVEGASATRATTSENGITTPEEGDFSIRMSKSDGTLSKTFNSLEEFRKEEAFPVGDYTLEAFYGEKTAEGFDKAYFSASENVTVRPGEVTNVSMTATLSKALVEVAYTDEFKAAYPFSAASLTSNNETFVEYADGETRAAYFVPGEINVNLNLKNTQGQSVTLKPATFKAEARHFYTLRIGVAPDPAGSGNLVLKVEFDDTVEAEAIDIDLTEELFTMAMPKVVCEGFTDGTPVTMPEGSAGDGFRMNVIAVGGIQSAELGFESDTFSPIFGNKIDLLKASAAQQGQIEALGIRALGFFRNPDRTALLDFSQFISSLPAGSHTVTLTVTDALGRVSEPAIMKINVEAVDIDATVPTPPAFQGNAVDVVVSTNNESVKDRINFEVSDASGVLHPAAIKNVVVESTRAGMTYSYRYTVELPVNETTFVDIVVKLGSKIVRTINQPKNMPEYTVETDAFTSKVYFRINASSSALVESITRCVVLLDGNDEIAENRITRKVHEGILEVTGFAPGTTYSNIRTAISSASNPVKKNVAAFTTESQLGVPNGDFENLKQTYNYTHNQGGQWTITRGGTRHQTTLSVAVSEPEGWATNNAMTMSGSTDNSWFRTPCAYASNLSWTVHQPSAKFIGIGQDGYDETPDAYKNFAVSSGSTSMIVRNVAWDPAGTVPTYKNQTGNTDLSNYFNSNSASCSRKAAGKLFLGSYSYSGGSESISQGVAFAARPAKLKGFYKYVNDASGASEKGKVTVSVMSGSTVLASGEVSLSAASSMTAFEIPLTYGYFKGAPTHLRIMITASDRTSDSDIPVTSYCTKQEQSFRGAELTVDNLTFEY